MECHDPLLSKNWIYLTYNACSLACLEHLYACVRCECSAVLTCCPISFQECDQVEYPVLKFTVKCANSFFRCLRRHGVFIPEPDRSLAVDACGLMCET